LLGFSQFPCPIASAGGPELAADVVSHLDRIDVVEVMMDAYLHSRRARGLRTLGDQVPIVLHGVSLGLGSVIPVDRSRLEAVARLVADVRPVFWSEHLAFVRGGGIELGHLAAPPRTALTAAAAARNHLRLLYFSSNLCCRVSFGTSRP
jgi:uncharacterized protein (UPF0276 family)